jgi:hypothetical protein
MRCGLVLACLFSLSSYAGTAYLVTKKTLTPQGSWTRAAQYFVQDGQVRAGASEAPTAYVFKDAKVYVLDNSSKTVQVVTSGLTTQTVDQMDSRVNSLEDSAAKLPPDRRAVLEKLVADMKAHNDQQRLPIPRDFHRTDRTETVDAHVCRVWEAFEGSVKRFEFCVAPTSAVAGSADILAGMQTLSLYWQGSIFALGSSLGQTGWWDGIAALDGVPILIREYRGGHVAAETTLTGIHTGVPRGSLLDVPGDYASTEVAFIP